jgi:uncharacterized membrane protein
MKRSSIGTIIGVIAAVIWHWLGGEALLWAAILGLVGFTLGSMLDRPGGFITFLQRLER